MIFRRSILLTTAAVALLPVTAVLAHSGHDAPPVHAHVGSPSALIMLGIIALGMAALVPMARLARRRRRPYRPH